MGTPLEKDLSLHFGERPAELYLLGIAKVALTLVTLENAGLILPVSGMTRAAVWESGAGHEAWCIRRWGVPEVVAVDDENMPKSPLFWPAREFLEGVTFYPHSIAAWLKRQTPGSYPLMMGFNTEPGSIFHHTPEINKDNELMSQAISNVLTDTGVLVLEGDGAPGALEIGSKLTSKRVRLNKSLSTPAFLDEFRAGNSDFQSCKRSAGSYTVVLIRKA